MFKLTGAVALAGTAGCSNILQQKEKPAKGPWDLKPYVRDEDRNFFERELSSFVPERIFDAHCHLHPPGFGNFMKESGVGYKEYMQLADALYPGRKVAAFFLGSSGKEASEWTSRHTAVDPLCRGAWRIRLDDDPEWMRQEIRRLGLSGLKCYHTDAKAKPTWEADIPQYLPEQFVRIAHEEGLAIILHMVKSRSVADAGNIHWIRNYCKTYPNMRLILAHSARAFQPGHALEGLPQLVGLDNLYFETSANPEPIAHEAIIRIFGHKKLMYGSDFPVSHMRGRSMAVADTFIWLYHDAPVWKLNDTPVKPVLVGLEVLRSIKWACWSARLDDSAIEDIFYNNAARLFGIDKS